MKTWSYAAVGTLLLAAIGCRDDTTAPAGPTETVPQASVATAALTFWQMSGGQAHSCAIAGDNAAWCWGDNSTGALGTGNATGPEGCFNFGAAPIPCSTRPAPVSGGRQFRRISAGYKYTCAVTTEFEGFCWGLNEFGKLGIDGLIAQSATPLTVAGGHRFRQIDTGGLHTCGVSYPDNLLYCWGYNTYGQLGDGTFTDRRKPVLVVGGLKVKQVGVGVWHTCAVTTTDRVYCWGLNTSGQLGDSTSAIRRARPAKVAGGHQFTLVDAGYEHTCAISLTSRAWCWGSGAQGQLGNGKTYLSFWPRAVSGGLSIRRLSAGWLHTCAETTTSRAWCWGSNADGQLGADMARGGYSATPVAVMGGLLFAQLSAGASHTCAKTSLGVGYCWGHNFFAQLGNGNSGLGATTGTPTPVSGPQ